MARLKKSDITEIWQSKNRPDRRYFVTRNHRVVMVIKEAFASAKMMYYMDGSELPVNFNGAGRFAHADNDKEAREFLNKVAVKEVRDATL